MKLDFGKLLQAIEKTESKKQTQDSTSEKLWNITEDKAGNGAAVIRFLPDQDINEVPFVKVISHGFKNEDTGRWYIENNLSTIGKEDPMDAINRKLWNDGFEDVVRKQKRQTSYYANILVVKDPANPDNEGQVRLFRFGKKILDKIVAAARPDELSDNDPINVFDPVAGANFTLKIKKVAGYRNYDDSSFGTPKAIGKEDEINEILSKCYSLQKELLDPSRFKPYDELVSKYKWVMGEDQARETRTASETTSTTQEAEDSIDREISAIAAEPVKASKPKATKAAPAPAATSDDDDDAFFKGLLED